MDIRPAVDADAEAVLALWVTAGALPSETDDQASLRRVASHGHLLLAVDDNGTVVGTLIAAFDGWRGNMYRLTVAPSERRRGIGRALVAAGETRLAEQGCRRITALVTDSEPGAGAFWRAAGYGHDHRMVRYVKTVPPAPQVPDEASGPYREEHSTRFD